jgi:hypothetical protein
MSTPSSLFPPQSAEEKARLDAFIHPKVAGDADGKCVVSAKKMQAIYDQLSVVLEEAHEILRISRRAAHASLLSEPLAVHFIGITQKTPTLYKKLSKLTTDLHLALPMVGIEFDHLKEYPPVKIAFVEVDDALVLKPCEPLSMDEERRAAALAVMPAFCRPRLMCCALDTPALSYPPPPPSPSPSGPVIFSAVLDATPPAPPAPPAPDDEEDLYA